MEIKSYKKDSFYSYTLGAFPTVELIHKHPSSLLKILIHSSFNNEEVIKEIQKVSSICDIQFNDKLISKLSQKENCYIIGIFKKYDMELEENQDHILLAQPMNMGNFGTIIRSALGFNIHNIGIISPCIDIFDPKVLRASMGSFFSSNIKIFPSFNAYKETYKNRMMHSFMLQATKPLQEHQFQKEKPTTLIFGNESSGLDISYLDENSLIIKHETSIDSLNLPNAVSIALYEFYKQKHD